METTVEVHSNITFLNEKKQKNNNNNNNLFNITGQLDVNYNGRNEDFYNKTKIPYRITSSVFSSFSKNTSGK